MIHSVGTLYAIQDLFDHLNNHVVRHDDFLDSFSKYGTSTANDVYFTATKLSWICRADDGQLVATETGKEAHRGVDRSTKLRFQLANIIERTKPVWGVLLPKGRKEAEAGLPDEIRQCFEEALLLGEMTDQVVEWWDRLSGIMREVSQRKLLDTGRAGERLTIRFEEDRTGVKPSWQSVESNYAGYDVLSVVDRNDQALLKIEVKASDRTFKFAEINVTQHEWTTATNAMNQYQFHVWLLNPKPTLFVVASQDIARHVPRNQGKGKWRNANIPIGAVTHPSKGLNLM